MLNLFAKNPRRQSPHSLLRGGRQARQHKQKARWDRLPQFECLEHRTLLTVTLNSSYTGMDINAAASGGFIFTPPDTCGAAGPTSYVETANQAVRIYTPKGTGASSVTSSMSNFLFSQGGLARADSTSTLSDVTVVFDELSQRFIVGDQDVDSTNLVSTFDIAVSKSASPATLTTADWKFYRINTTESNHDADYPGNMGFNHDAFVFTLTQFGAARHATTHIQITSIAMSDLVAGNPITPFQSDISSNTLRPTTMHDSVAGDPMWFVAEGGANSINVVKMTNVLSSSPTFTTTSLAVNAYSAVVAPLQPDGTAITTNIDSRIEKAAEFNKTIVASQAISTSATQDNARWYAINVSGASPTLAQQGNVSAGNNKYIVYPSIDINSSGAIGMTYLQSGTAAGQFMSMYVTGRNAGDAAGTMQTPVLVQAGVANETGGREGDLSGINVDSDGSFWAANEWAANPATTSTFANWSTAIAHFSMGTKPTITPPADQAAVEGASQAISLGSFSDPDGGPWSVTVAWGDGSPNTTFSAAAAGSLGTQLHMYTEQGTFTVTVTVQDSTALSDVKTFKVNVSDPAVVPTGSFSISPVEGASTGAILLATFTDPGGPEPVGDYSADINWGDGTGLQVGAGSISLNASTFEVRGTHTYAEASSAANPGSTPYQISITVHHETSTISPSVTTATVSDALLNATGVNVSATEGVAFTGPVATFTDANPAAPLSDYTATIQWDSNPAHTSAGTIALVAGMLTVSGSNTYAETGSYPVSVTINDVDGSSANAASLATVSDALLNATGVNVSATEGVAFTGPVATFTDANPAAPLSDYMATIQWDSNPAHTSAGTIALVAGTLTVSGSNTYAAQGSYTISVTINDADASNATCSSTANVVAQNSQVMSRQIFYAGSSRYDTTGNPQTPLPFSDDNAIATDKAAYLPGSGAATFANVSSYDRGINGVMVDLLGGGSHGSITLANILADFTFKVGNDNSPGTWSAAPNPMSVTVRPGAGVSGSDRVELIWADGAITQKWLEVTVNATPDTGLIANDVFFYGSEIGNTGSSNTATFALTTNLDVSDAVNHGATIKQNIPITDLYDFSRDGNVNNTDVSDAVNHGTTIKTGLVFINISAAGPFAPMLGAAQPLTTASAAAAPSGNAAIASALTTPSTATSNFSGSASSAAELSSVVDEQLLELLATHRHRRGLRGS